MMSNEYIGGWRIIEMEEWDQDYVDFAIYKYSDGRYDPDEWVSLVTSTSMERLQGR